jgi:hypothetical protein
MFRSEGINMPILATESRDDARGSARILALKASACLANRDSGASKEVVLNNVYRLLEAYKNDVFFEAGAANSESSLESSDFFSEYSRETHLADVRGAITSALEAVFGTRSVAQIIGRVEDVLRSVAYPDEYPSKSTEELKTTENFFDKVAMNLSTNAIS